MVCAPDAERAAAAMRPPRATQGHTVWQVARLGVPQELLSATHFSPAGQSVSDVQPSPRLRGSLGPAHTQSWLPGGHRNVLQGDGP
jgi:hypothetical protein